MQHPLVLSQPPINKGRGTKNHLLLPRDEQRNPFHFQVLAPAAAAVDTAEPLLQPTTMRTTMPTTMRTKSRPSEVG